MALSRLVQIARCLTLQLHLNGSTSLLMQWNCTKNPDFKHTWCVLINTMHFLVQDHG